MVWQMGDSWLYQRRATRALEEAASAPDSTLQGREPPPAELPAKIEIPRLGISSMIVAEDGAVDLRHGVIHIEGTAGIGAEGNVGLAGHRDTYFRGLEQVSVGDTIFITTPRERLLYIVSWKRVVKPEAVEVLDPTPDPTLTLVTCYPFHYVGPAPERFVVRASGRGDPRAVRSWEPGVRSAVSRTL
jgi:sortase A